MIHCSSSKRRCKRESEKREEGRGFSSSFYLKWGRHGTSSQRSCPHQEKAILDCRLKKKSERDFSFALFLLFGSSYVSSLLFLFLRFSLSLFSSLFSLYSFLHSLLPIVYFPFAANFFATAIASMYPNRASIPAGPTRSHITLLLSRGKRGGMKPEGMKRRTFTPC